MDESSGMLTIEQVARFLGLGRSKCYDMVARGELPQPIRFGPRSMRISRTVLEQWLSERQAVPANHCG